MNFRHIAALYCTLAAAFPAEAGGAIPLPTDGNSWAYTQYEQTGIKLSVLATPEFQFGYRNEAKDWVVLVRQAAQRTGIPDASVRPFQVAYVLTGDVCITDIAHSRPIVNGDACALPLSQGMAWRIEESRAAGLVMRDLRVEGEEEIVTPAGKFSALRIRETATISAQGSEPRMFLRATYWYAEQVRGLVKIQRQQFAEIGAPAKTSVDVLDSYSVR